MALYRKKTPAVKAVQWYRDNSVDCVKPDGIENINPCPICGSLDTHGIFAGNINSIVHPGDWIVYFDGATLIKKRSFEEEWEEVK